MRTGPGALGGAGGGSHRVPRVGNQAIRGGSNRVLAAAAPSRLFSYTSLLLFGFFIYILARYHRRAAILFSPLAGPQGLPPATLAEWILVDGLDVRLGLQLHKIIWPGRDRGV